MHKKKKKKHTKKHIRMKIQVYSKVSKMQRRKKKLSHCNFPLDTKCQNWSINFAKWLHFGCKWTEGIITPPLSDKTPSKMTHSKLSHLQNVSFWKWFILKRIISRLTEHCVHRIQVVRQGPKRYLTVRCQAPKKPAILHQAHIVAQKEVLLALPFHCPTFLYQDLNVLSF